MSVSQAEFVAFKQDAADRMKKIEDIIEGAIQTAVTTSEAKAGAALTEVRNLFRSCTEGSRRAETSSHRSGENVSECEGKGQMGHEQTHRSGA